MPYNLGQSFQNLDSSKQERGHNQFHLFKSLFKFQGLEDYHAIASSEVLATAKTGIHCLFHNCLRFFIGCLTCKICWILDCHTLWLTADNRCPKYFSSDKQYYNLSSEALFPFKAKNCNKAKESISFTLLFGFWSHQQTTHTENYRSL